MPFFAFYLTPHTSRLYLLPAALQFWQAALGIAVAYATFPSYFSPEGWLDVEHHASDLRGTRGTCLVSGSMWSKENHWKEDEVVMREGRG